MHRQDPLILQHGPFTVYVKPLAGCPALQPLLHSLPLKMPVMWCDSARQHPATGRWSLLGYDPWLTLIARGQEVEVRTSAATHLIRSNPLDALRQILRRYRAPASVETQAKAIGLMGFLSYDVNRWIERLPAPQPALQSIPEMVWCGMKVVVLVDHLQQRSWVFSVVDPHAPQPFARREACEALEQAIASLGVSSVHEPHRCSTDAGGAAPRDSLNEEASGNRVVLEATSTPAAFASMVSRALDYIRAGDIFQANVSQRFTTPWSGSARDLYDRLRRINPSPFACFLSWEDLSVVSCSPERLVRVQEGCVETRPIAGTRPRGATPQDDAMNSLELLLSEKERAEHIMLVDLARNDVGRVCDAGSVGVNEFMTLEEYSHVIHIVSNVKGQMRRGMDAVDIIRAVFPGGTITGCPKVRCMQILRELEPVARGLYTGSLGYLGFDGTMDLNIAIRTMVIQGQQLSFHVGAGIVADSLPEREYHETLAKAQALIQALQGSGERFRDLHAASR